jgi:hypothetical protein
VTRAGVWAATCPVFSGRLVENELSSLLLRESVGDGDAVDVSLADGRLAFAVRRGEAAYPQEPTWRADENAAAPSGGPAEPRG